MVTTETRNPNRGMMDIATDGDLWVMTGGFGQIAVSIDGVDWTSPPICDLVPINGVAANGELWVQVGEGGTLCTSPDGRTWTRLSGHGDAHAGFELEYLTDAAFGGGRWIVVGRNGFILTSPDGITWTQQTSETAQGLNGVGIG